MPKGQTVSSTPILDFERPLPIPDDRRVTGRFALPLLSFVLFICWIDNVAFLIVPLGVLLIGFLSTLVHEAGHVIAGMLVGLQFDGVIVGPFAIRRHYNRWHFRLRPRISSGMTYMSFAEFSRIRRREIAGILGGPLSSLAFGLAALIGGEVMRSHYDSPWPTFFEFFGIFSFFIGSIAFLPRYSGRYAGDGILLRAFIGNISGGKQIIAGHALGVLYNKNPECPVFHPRWLRLAYAEGSLLPPYYHNWYAYSVASDPMAASQHLEQCLANSGLLDPHERDALIAEVVLFMAWQRAASVKAQKWFALIRKLDQLPKLAGLRMKAAISSASGDFTSALGYCDAGLYIIEKQGSGPGATEFLKSWRSWRSEIEKRDVTTRDRVEAIAQDRSPDTLSATGPVL